MDALILPPYIHRIQHTPGLLQPLPSANHTIVNAVKTTSDDHRMPSCSIAPTCVAADCWKRLSRSEKEAWYEKAEQQKLEHNQKHPHYQYKPAKRGPVPKRRQPVTRQEAVEHCNNMRRIYLPHTESVVPESSTLRRRSKRKPSAKVNPSLNYSEPDHPAPTPRPHSPLQYEGPVFDEPLIFPASPGRPFDSFISDLAIMDPNETWIPNFEKDPETAISACLIPSPESGEDVIEEQQIEESVSPNLPSGEAQNQQSFYPPFYDRFTFYRQPPWVSSKNKPQPMSGSQVSPCPSQDASPTATVSNSSFPNIHVPTSADSYFVSSIFVYPDPQEQNYHPPPVGTTSFQPLPMSFRATGRPSESFNLRPQNFSAEASLRFYSDANACVFPPIPPDRRKPPADSLAPNGSTLSDQGGSLQNDTYVDAPMGDPAPGGSMLSNQELLLQEPLSNMNDTCVDASMGNPAPGSSMLLDQNLLLQELLPNLNDACVDAPMGDPAPDGFMLPDQEFLLQEPLNDPAPGGFMFPDQELLLQEPFSNLNDTCIHASMGDPAPGGFMLSDLLSNLNDTCVNAPMCDPAPGDFMLPDQEFFLQEPLSNLNDPGVSSYEGGLPPSVFMLSNLGISSQESLLNDQPVNLPMDSLQPTGLPEMGSTLYDLFSEPTLGWPVDESWGLA